MEFIIEKKKLLDCLNHFQSVVEKRNTIPILSNIKITTDASIQNRLIFTATDLALEISEKLDVKLVKPGGITIPSQLFYELIRKAPEGCNITVSYEESSNNAIVLFNNSKFNFPTMPIDDFPVMDNKDLDREIDLDIKSLKHLINNCKFCMGLDESRQYLNGIFFHVSNEQISAVATDGHRLAKCVLEKKTDIDFDGIIIPKKSVYEISKVLDESNNPIMDNSLLQLHTDSNGKATTHILNGNPSIKASIGVTNILKFFTVDLIKRLNYLDEKYEVTSFYEQRVLRVRFSAKFDF